MLTGGCLCGRVRYQAQGETWHENTCHCGQCRRATGAPFGAWFTVKREGLTWLGEEPRRYASSARAERGFCPHCGTALTYEARPDRGAVDLSIASLDDPAAVRVRDELYVKDRLPWVPPLPGVRQHQGERDG